MTFDSTSAYQMLHRYFQGRVLMQEPLARHSSFGVGGPADLWLSLQSRLELNDLVMLCTQEQWPLLLVGNGSNILYADEGVRGIVAQISLNHHHIKAQPDGSALLLAEPGVQWNQLIEELVPQGWGGLEFAIGIPGTVGAGVISNVGAHNQELGQALEWIEELDARSCNVKSENPQVFPVTAFRRLQHDELDLGYRHSRFRENRITHVDTQGHLLFPPRGLIEPDELIVLLALRLHRQASRVLASLVEQDVRERKEHDPAQRHLGSIFKDGAGLTAQSLLEQAGVAGRRRGNAQISERNANYIVNLGGATAADIAALLVEAHQEVLTRFHIHLSLNVELLGEWHQEQNDTMKAKSTPPTVEV